MKRLFFVMGVVAIVMAMFVAQSGAAVVAQDGTGTPEATPTMTLVPSEEGTLTIWINQDRASIVDAVSKQFTEKYGIPVRIQTMGFGDVRSNFNIAAPAGEGPDVIVGAHDWIGQLYANGLLAPVTLSEDVLKQFDPQAIKAFTYDGKLVAVPYQIEAVAMYYNTDLVPEPPKTWDEAIAISKKLVEEGKVDQGIAVPPDAYHSYPLFSQFGGYVFGTDANGNYDPNNVGLDSEGFLKGAEFLDKLVKDKVFSAAVGYGEASDLFHKGRLAMWVTGPWELNNIRKAGVNYAVAKIPTATDKPARPFIGAQGFMVNEFSKNKDLALAFVSEFIASQEAQQAAYDAAPAVSAFLPVREANPDKDLAGFAASIADGEPMPTIPQMAAFWNVAGNAVTLVYQQKEAPDAAFQAAAKAARDEIAKGSK